jgi:hypothetical protein
MEKGNPGHKPWSEIMHRRRPAQLQEATGLSEAAVRSVLWQARQLGYRVATIAEFSACQRSDGTWRVHSDMSVHMCGCTPVVVITEEWTP